MPPAVFEPTFPAIERLETHPLDSAATVCLQPHHQINHTDVF